MDNENGTFGSADDVFGGEPHEVTPEVPQLPLAEANPTTTPAPPILQTPSYSAPAATPTETSTEKSTWGATSPSTPTPTSYTTSSDAVEYELVDSDPGTGGSSKLPWVFAVVAALFLLGGGGFFAASAFGASGGEESPEEAIDAMFAAMEEEDFVAVAELLEPSERRTLAEPALTELLPELVRLGVFDESADAGDVEGLDLVFTDVEHRVERLAGVDDLAHVYITGGELATNIDGELLPLSDDFDADDLSFEQSQSLVDPDVPLVFVERDGSWYFSLLFTAAENARLDAGESLPGVDEAPTPIGGDSPEEAITGMFAAMVDFDLESVVGHMDPEEMAVLYRYSPLFLEDAQAGLDEARGELQGENISWEIGEWDFDVDESGDDAVVSIRGFTVDVSANEVDLSVTYSRDQLTGNLNFDDGFTSGQGTLDATTTEVSLGGVFDELIFDGTLAVVPEENTVTGQLSADGETFEGTLVFDPDGICSEITVSGSDGTNETFCLEDEAGFEGLGVVAQAMEDWPSEFPGIEMRTRQTDGAWFVSPIGTLFDSVLASLEDLEEGDFDDVFNPIVGVAGDAVLDPFDVLEDLNGDDDPVFDAIDAIETDDFVEFDDEVFDDVEPDFGSGPALPGAVADIAVASGESGQFEGILAPNFFDPFLIDLTEGEVVTVTVQADDSGLDPVLTVLGANGNQIAENDDAFPSLPGSGLDSQLEFTAGETGQFTFEVAGFSQVDFGAYILTVDRDTEASIVAEGSPTATPSAPVPSPDAEITVVTGTVGDAEDFVLPIELFGGEPVSITVESDGPGVLDPVVELELDGSLIGRNDDAQDSSAVADNFDSQLIPEIVQDGEYTIIVSGFAGSAGDFTMTIAQG